MISSKAAPLLGETDRRIVHALESLLPWQRLRRTVELGCGGGTLSLWLGTKVSGEVTGVDASAASLQEAARRATQYGISNVRFRETSVCDTGFDSGYADLVICKNLLCTLPKPIQAVREISRLLPEGGIAVAVEPAAGQVFFDSEDERFVQLSSRLHRAFLQGWAVRGADQNIGLKVPGLFMEAGFNNITADCVAPVCLLCDDRRTEGDVLEQLATESAQLPEQTAAMLMKGGITKADLREHAVRAQERFARFRADPQQIKKSAYVRLLSPLVITVARKACDQIVGASG